MKISEIKQRSGIDLEDILKKKRERLRQLRFDLAAGKVKNIREIRMIKKDMARILTLLCERASSSDRRALNPKSQ
jgi:large subunit ribosomal protein L29